MFWIKAEIYETILNNWSIVRIGTSANQKRVFFNLSRAKRALGIMDNNLSDEQTKQIAEYLDVPEKDVANMAAIVGDDDVLNAVADYFINHYETRVNEGSTVAGKWISVIFELKNAPPPKTFNLSPKVTFVIVPSFSTALSTAGAKNAEA